MRLISISLTVNFDRRQGCRSDAGTGTRLPAFDVLVGGAVSRCRAPAASRIGVGTQNSRFRSGARREMSACTDQPRKAGLALSGKRKVGRSVRPLEETSSCEDSLDIPPRYRSASPAKRSWRVRAQRRCRMARSGMRCCGRHARPRRPRGSTNGWLHLDCGRRNRLDAVASSVRLFGDIPRAVRSVIETPLMKDPMS